MSEELVNNELVEMDGELNAGALAILAGLSRREIETGEVVPVAGVLSPLEEHRGWTVDQIQEALLRQ